MKVSLAHKTPLYWLTFGRPGGPCKAIGPILEELASEHSEKVKIGKVNVDDNSELASKYEVRAIPTIKIFKNGSVVDTVVGLASKEDLISKIA